MSPLGQDCEMNSCNRKGGQSIDTGFIYQVRKYYLCHIQVKLVGMGLWRETP